jgi:hypothetical protein
MGEKGVGSSGLGLGGQLLGPGGEETRAGIDTGNFIWSSCNAKRLCTRSGKDSRATVLSPPPLRHPEESNTERET